MAYVITDSCVNCGTCEGECQVGTCTNRTVTDVAVLFFVCIYSFCNSFLLFKNVMVFPAI